METWTARMRAIFAGQRRRRAPLRGGSTGEPPRPPRRRRRAARRERARGPSPRRRALQLFAITLGAVALVTLFEGSDFNAWLPNLGAP